MLQKGKQGFILREKHKRMLPFSTPLLQNSQWFKFSSVHRKKGKQIKVGKNSLDWNPMQEEEKKTYLNIENRNFRSKAKSGKKLKNNKATKKKTLPA